MKIPKYIDNRIDEIEPSEKKEVWEQLKETEEVYVIIPSIDSLNYRYEHLNSHLKMKPLDSLRYSKEYYNNVNEIYQKYDFILPMDFFECTVHANEYDYVYVTDKTRDRSNKICEKIDDRIKELEKKFS